MWSSDANTNAIDKGLVSYVWGIMVALPRHIVPQEGLGKT